MPQIDGVNLTDGNVLYAIDLGTESQSRTFISHMDGSTIWRMLSKCWINIYASAPDVLYGVVVPYFNS